jgi:ankyrin repeat protein
VTEILDRGGDISSLDCVTFTQHNDTPLHLAVHNEHLEVAELLLKSGADPHQRNLHGESAQDIAESSRNSKLILAISEYATSRLSEGNHTYNNSQDQRNRISNSEKKQHNSTSRGESKVIPYLRNSDLRLDSI